MNISKLSRSELIALNLNKGSIINLQDKMKDSYILIYQSFDKDDQSNYLSNFITLVINDL
jgi:hypothetical protein